LRSLTLLSLLLLSSCSPRWTYVQDTGGNTAHPYRVCVRDPDLSIRVSPAIDVWRTALAGWRPLVQECPGDVSVEYGPAASCVGVTALACADRIGGSLVTLITGRSEYDPAGLLAHELGHIFGAQHVSGTLMSPVYSRGNLCPDMATVVQVAAYQRADLTLFAWCH